MPRIKRVLYASSLKPIFQCHNTIMGNLSNIVTCKYDTDRHLLLLTLGVSCTSMISLLTSFCPQPLPPPPSPYQLSTYLGMIGTWKTVCGLKTGYWGLPAIGALYGLGAGLTQWRPLDIPGTNLPYSMMQLSQLKDLKMLITLIFCEVCYQLLGHRHFSH